MWIDNGIAKPLREGRYKTLIDSDGFGNLKEGKNELFNGRDWDWMDSSAQYIFYWFANEEDYEIIAERLEKEMEEYENR